MKFPRSVTFHSLDVEIEEVQIEPEIIEDIPEEPEVQIFELTEDELNAKLEEAYQNGYNTGFDEAEEKVSEPIKQKENQLTLLISNFESSEGEFFSRVESYIVNIASKIAENLVHDELKHDPTKIKNIVTSALARLKESRSITIFLSEDDFFLIEEINLHEAVKFSSEVEIKLLPKENLTNGNFYIESDMGNLYSIITEQIDELKRQL